MKINKDCASFNALTIHFSNNFDNLFTFIDQKVNLRSLWKKSDYKRHAGTDSLILVLLGLSKLIHKSKGSVRGFFHQVSQAKPCSKDSFYRLQRNSSINWRNFLLHTTKVLLSKAVKDKIDTSGSYSPDFDQKLNSMTFWVFDDSIIKKSGRHIEGISKVHDHTDMRYHFGFKLLAMAIVQSTMACVVDFALVEEQSKVAAKLKRFKKKLKGYCQGHVRRRELKNKKNDLSMDMIARARKKGLKADYILFDSWFFSLEFIKKITGGKKGCSFVGGLKKSNRKFQFEDEMVDLNSLIKRKKHEVIRNRSFGSQYIEIVCILPNFGKVKIFASRYKKRNKWIYLITDDLSLSYEQALRIYSMRWNIEICFKELKHYLGMDKCQASDFDAQIAHISSCCLLHSLIRFYQTHQENSTFGELFEEFENQAQSARHINHHWQEFEQVIVWLSEILGGAKNISVADLLSSSLYAEVCSMIGSRLRISTQMGCHEIKQEITLSQ